MDYPNAQVQFWHQPDEEGIRGSSYADRTSKYSTASEGDEFESAEEGVETDDESETDTLSSPKNEIVSPKTPQGTFTSKKTIRAQSITSQITIRPNIRNELAPMEPPSSNPFKSSVNTFEPRSRSNSAAEVQPYPPLTENNRSRSLSHIRGPTPPVATSTRGKLPTSDFAVQLSSSSSSNTGINVAFEILPNPIQSVPSRMRPVTATSSSSAPSVREPFSSPPMFSRTISHASVGGTSGGSGASTPSIHGHQSTAASSALALTAHIPGLGGPLSMFDHFHSPSLDLSGDDLKKTIPEKVMESTLLQTEVPKPWLYEKDWRTTASWWIMIFMISLGVVSSAFLTYWDYKTTPVITQPLCLVMEDDFDTFSVDTEGAIWTREVDLSGFGNGEFEIATNSPNNSFVKDGMLYIMPTLTALSIPGGDASIFDGFTFNLTGCTNKANFEGTACGAVSNATSGTVINPVMSARLTTANSHSIKYGKVEIRAKIPTGDWLWPALWMLPTNNTYGPWPLSGEIDIMESRGNGLSYPPQGSNFVRGTLNWGPTAFLNAGWRTFGFWTNRRRSYADDFHIYSLEWTPDFIRTYVDSRLHFMLNLRFNEPFFNRGQFPQIIQNGSSIIALENPWIGRGNSAPFDQSFYLIMDVAVGGTNGWFPDGVGGKPWLDQSATAMRDFAKAQDQWYTTWPVDPQDRAMVVDYVKMWQLC